ncbi:hypothetical protein V6N13_059865 [Hibiscus sabdariffa]
MVDVEDELAGLSIGEDEEEGRAGVGISGAVNYGRLALGSRLGKNLRDSVATTSASISIQRGTLSLRPNLGQMVSSQLGPVGVGKITMWIWPNWRKMSPWKTLKL